MEKEKEFKPCNKCLDCMNYCRGGYEYHSDWEGYVEEGCDINQVPDEECNRYMPTDEKMHADYIKELEDYIKELEEMLLEIQSVSKCTSNEELSKSQVFRKLDELIDKYELE